MRPGDNKQDGRENGNAKLTEDFVGELIKQDAINRVNHDLKKMIIDDFQAKDFIK